MLYFITVLSTGYFEQDLEALHDMNEELQENAREVELELREEIDLLQVLHLDLGSSRWT